MNLKYYDYHFLTQWRVQAPIQKVYDILKDGERYQDWWKPAYRSTVKVGERKIRALVRALLPYTLEFTTELLREDPPRELELKSTGELEGMGLWKLRQEGDFTEVEFIWDVRANKPLVRWLSFLLKPLFRWNHDWVMNTGQDCLKAELSRAA